MGQKFFDVAVLDIRMPDIDGIELLTRLWQIREFGFTASMLSGHAHTELAMQAGTDDFFAETLRYQGFAGKNGGIV